MNIFFADFLWPPCAYNLFYGEPWVDHENMEDFIGFNMGTSAPEDQKVLVSLFNNNAD